MPSDFEIRMRVDGAAAFRDTARRLRDAGRKDLKLAMAKRIRAEGRPVVLDVRAAVLATPSKGTRPSRSARGHRGGLGLRQAMARATTVATSASKTDPSIRIKVARGRMPYGTRAVPRYYEGAARPWRHPVFGEWLPGQASQQPRPFFYATITAHSSDFRRAIVKAIRDTLDELERGPARG